MYYWSRNAQKASLRWSILYLHYLQSHSPVPPLVSQKTQSWHMLTAIRDLFSLLLSCAFSPLFVLLTGPAASLHHAEGRHRVPTLWLCQHWVRVSVTATDTHWAPLPSITTVVNPSSLLRIVMHKKRFYMHPCLWKYIYIWHVINACVLKQRTWDVPRFLTIIRTPLYFPGVNE